MYAYVLRRIGQAMVVLVLISLATFAIIHAAPGGPSVLLGESLTAEDRANIRRTLGLDEPVYVQYVRWSSAMLRFDFGRSFAEGLPVIDLLARRLPNTLYLAAAAFLLACLIGIPVGVLSAVRRNSVADHVATLLSFIGVATPSFWLAIMGVILFSVHLRWLPTSGMATMGADFSWADRARHLLMPMIVLAASPLAEIVRYTRSTMLDALSEDYVRTARAKGLRPVVILYKHTLRNAFIPVLTVLGLIVPPLIGGSVIVETIFSWPGMGRLAVDAAMRRDYPVMMGVTIVLSIVVIVVNLIVDLLYGVLDPRVRFARGGGK